MLLPGFPVEYLKSSAVKLLINWHPHVHTIVTEGVFTDSGYFIRIPQVDMAGCLSPRAARKS